MTRRWVFAALVVVTGTGVLAPALAADARPVQALGWAAAATVLFAAVTGHRSAGTLSVVAVTAGLLAAATVDPLTTAGLLAASVLLLGMLLGLDGAERARTGGEAELVRTASRTRLVAPPLLAVAGAGAVALAAGGPVVPSAWLALAGLAAVATALAVAARPR